MKFSISLFVSLIFTISLNAQIKSIKLPKGEETIEIKNITHFYSIYVDNINAVYLENEKIAIKDVGNELFNNNAKFPEEQKFRSFVYLFIDKKVPYHIVDAIKTQVASAGLVNIVYKTKSIKDKHLLNGIYWRNLGSITKISNSDENTNEKSPEQTIDDETLNNPMAGFDIPPPPPPPPMFWGDELQKELYNLNYKNVNDILSNKKYACLTMSYEGIKIRDKYIKFDNLDEIEALFENNKVLFLVYHPKINYELYLETTRLLKSMLKKTDNKTMVIEQSFDLLKAKKRDSIKFCD